jgi:hypothetical protein
MPIIGVFKTRSFAALRMTCRVLSRIDVNQVFFRL